MRLGARLILINLVFVSGTHAAEPPWGRRVTHLRLESDANLSIEEFTPQIAQKVGEPLDASRVSETLKNLYATGRFSELRADWEATAEGVELVFVGRAQFFVGRMEVEGAPGAVEPRALINASRLRLGLPISEEELAAARPRLLRILADNGYFQAQVEHGLHRRPESQEADIVFSITPGRAAVLSKVEFQGNPAAPPEKLAAVAGWRPGKHLTAPRIERGLFKIHQFYVAKGRLQATTSIQQRVYDPQAHAEKLLVRTDAGPLVHVRVRGASISRSRMQDLLPVFREGVVDDPVLKRGQQALEDYFQRQGYFSVTTRVQKAVQRDTQELDITYTVTLGTQGEFRGYGFKGNHSLPTAALVAAIATGPQDISHPRGAFSRSLLEEDLKTLRELYQSRGFLEPRIQAGLNDHYADQPGQLFVTFNIEEGPKTTVRNLVLRGVDAAMQREIWPLLATKSGQPYSPELAQLDHDAILGFLADRGFSEAAVRWQASALTSDHRVDLEFRIQPGVQQRVRRILVLGNRHTRDGLIQRALTVRKGRPLSQSDLLESQRRLYDLGIFNQVQIATQAPQSSETAKTVLVDVEETRRWTVGYGGGLELQRLGSDKPQGTFKASPRLSLDVTRLNVGGRGQTFALRGRLSNLEKGGALSYLLPHLFTRRDLSLRVNGLVDRSRDVLTFTADRKEASVSIEKRFSPATLLLGRYSFRRVLALDISKRISDEQIPLFSRPARVGMLGASYVNDHRDNLADATQGSYSLADAGVAWAKFGSESNFLRLTGQNATYHRLGTHLILARNTRFGVESPYGALRLVRISGEDQPPQFIRTHEIPLPERFFMGGSESHRGFSINQAGPRDLSTGFPIGGNALFFNSLELRMPFADNRYGFVLFHDAGNVFSTIRKMRLLKFTQSSPTDFDFASHAVGSGFRYKTPIGPVRFDVGYNPNPPRFQAKQGETMEVRRLSHLQFFFSIGQSF